MVNENVNDVNESFLNSIDDAYKFYAFFSIKTNINSYIEKQTNEMLLFIFLLKKGPTNQNSVSALIFFN